MNDLLISRLEVGIAQRIKVDKINDDKITNVDCFRKITRNCDQNPDH